MHKKTKRRIQNKIYYVKSNWTQTCTKRKERWVLVQQNTNSEKKDNEQYIVMRDCYVMDLTKRSGKLLSYYTVIYMNKINYYVHNVDIQ